MPERYFPLTREVPEVTPPRDGQCADCRGPISEAGKFFEWKLCAACIAKRMTWPRKAPHHD